MFCFSFRDRCTRFLRLIEEGGPFDHFWGVMRGYSSGGSSRPSYPCSRPYGVLAPCAAGDEGRRPYEVLSAYGANPALSQRHLRGCTRVLVFSGSCWQQPLFSADIFWFLDVVAGELNHRWATEQDFSDHLNSRAGQDKYLMIGLATAADEAGLKPSANEGL